MSRPAAERIRAPDRPPPAPAAPDREPERVQQAVRAVSNQQVLRRLRAGAPTVSDPGDAAEQDADRAGRELAAGRPMAPGPRPAPLIEPGGIWLHTGPHADDATRALGAHALTLGNDVVLGRTAPPADSAAGRALLGHELAHVLQHRAAGRKAATVVHRQVAVPSPVSIGPVHPTATFVLDPALSQTSPPDVTTHLRVVDPFAVGPVVDRFVAIDYQVRSVTPVRVYAVPLMQLFDNPVEASSMDTSEFSRVPPAVEPGQFVWTSGGEFTVLGSVGSVAFSAAPVPESVAAAAVLLVRTSGPTVLVDLGQQGSRPDDRAALGTALAAQLLRLMPLGQLDEAVPMPGAPAGYSIAQVAQSFAVGTVRATASQVLDATTRDTVLAVQRAQATYRDALARQLREQLSGTRANWEASQPIAPNESLREQRWTQHLDEVVAASLGQLPTTTTRMSTMAGSVLTLPADAAEAIPGTGATDQPPAPPHAIVDRTDVEWAPADDQLILIQGGGSLYAIRSRGLLLRPLHAAPEPVTVPGLRATGPTGPTPVGARTPTPWVAVPAVGHAGLTMVRTAQGPGILIDNGVAARYMNMGVLGQLLAQLGLSEADTIAVTHPHADHVQQLAQTILARGIRAERLVLADSWIRAGGSWLRNLVETLRTEPYRALGFTADWTPVAATAAGVAGAAHAQFAVAGGQVDIFTNPAAHDRLRTAAAAGQKPKQLSKLLDPSSLLFVMGNETSPHRVAVLGDLRGTDILGMAGLPGDPLGRALTGVRMIVGFGHHLGADAGSSARDVQGYELLFRETLIRNGELTIVVQSTPDFADLATGNPLLEMARGMGATVVFAGEPGTTGGGAVVRSDLTVGVYGTGIQTFAGDPAVQAALARLQLLRAADRTVADDPEIGPRYLRLEQQTAAQIRAALAPEISRLETLLNELLGLRAADLLDARDGPNADFRGARTTPGRTVALVLADLAQRGPFETALDPQVVTSLRVAAMHASPLAVEAQLLSTPREVADVISGLPRELRESLERQYREIREIVQRFPGESVPPAEHLDLLHRVEVLRASLDQALAGSTAAGRPHLEAELARMDARIATLMAPVETRVETGRDAEGNVTRTEVRSLRAPSDSVDRAFGRVGQLMGALMVIHSIQGLARTTAGIRTGDVGIPQALFQAGSGALNLNIGVRMVTVEQVSPVLFVAVAVLDAAAILSDPHLTREQRDAQLIALSVDQLCLAAGMAVMHGGALLPHPVAKGVVMSLGLAITLSGSRLLGWLGLDDWLQRVADFRPDEVVHVGQRIEGALHEYEAIVGVDELSRRTDAQLRAVGATDPADLRQRAAEARELHLQRAHEKELELVGLFRDAYQVAGTSYAGLRYLDAAAARFARLRFAALPADEARTAIQRSFTEMDPQTTTLRTATPDQVARLPQWDTVFSEQVALGEALDARPPDWSDVMEHLGRLAQVMGNARYRIAPTGGYRAASFLAPGTPAYEEYVRTLAARERTTAELLARVTRVTGSPTAYVPLPAVTDSGPDPAAGASLVQTLHTAYDQRVAEASTAAPELGDAALWHDSNALMRTAERAHQEHPQVFVRLQAAETALQIAVEQARTALTLRPSSSPLVVELVRRETSAADRAIDDRTVVHGLVLPTELDSVLTERRRAEDRTLAASIDARLPRTAAANRAATGTLPLSENEIVALHDDRLSGQGARMTSTEHQLARALELISPIRAVDIGDALDRTRTRRIERELLVPRGGSFWTYSPGLFDSAAEVTVPGGATILLARVGADIWGRTELWSGPASYTTVLPISEAAVDLLGSDAVHIRINDLVPADVRDLR